MRQNETSHRSDEGAEDAEEEDAEEEDAEEDRQEEGTRQGTADLCHP